MAHSVTQDPRVARCFKRLLLSSPLTLMCLCGWMWTHVCIQFTKSSLSVFTTLGSLLYQSSNGTNNRGTPPYYGHASVREYPDSSISKVLTVLKWRMITTLNRKLLEKQRVQNRFASYEIHIGHFFYNINAAVSFGNRLTLSIFRF